MMGMMMVVMLLIVVKMVVVVFVIMVVMVMVQESGWEIPRSSPWPEECGRSGCKRVEQSKERETDCDASFSSEAID